MKYQTTSLDKNIINLGKRLESWTKNPWRKYSFLIIIFLSAFFIGGSIGMINGVLALMDPIGALFSVILIEALIRIRRSNIRNKEISILYKIIDSFRMGFVYGLLMEGFKLI